MNKNSYKVTKDIKVSFDQESRDSKESKDVTVTFLYNDWSPEELIDRLMVSNSPVVAVQALLRKLKEIPATYTYIVPKAGTRVATDWFSKLASIVGIDQAKMLSDTYGSAEEAIKAMFQKMQDAGK